MTQNMDAYWMPFSANRQFKKAPRLLAKSKGMHFWTPEGREILDGVAGLWCVNAGHARPKIVQAIAEQAARGLTYMLPTEDVPVVGELLAGMFGLPAGLLTIFIVSLLTPAPSKEVQELVEHVRYPNLKGDTVVSQAT